MCGIAGIVYFNNERIVEEYLLKKMTDSIIHRGPDDEGFYIHKNIGLGFRRLSIIDLNTGHQPLSNEDSTVWIVFNGEIYNFPELRDRLMKMGHIFKTKTDTEAIIHLYEQYGVNCLQYLRGMFAFVIYDQRQNIMFCARDRFGIKPFYYYVDSEKFIFGSEIKAILQVAEVDNSINLKALDDYFAYGYILGNKSIYQNIFKLQPANYLEFNTNNYKFLESKSYWDFAFVPDYTKTEDQWNEEIFETFSEVVKMRMISDVPLGAFLSGGIDSSSVVAFMAKNSNIRIKTFSIGFKEKKYNELDYAREVARRYNTEHYEQIIEPESIDLIPKLVRAFDEPYADSSAIPTYYVSKFAREHVTVALSGDGGDELFAGYDSYSRLNSVHKTKFFPDSFNKAIFQSLYQICPNSLRIKKVLFYLSKSDNELGPNCTVWNHFERKKLFQNEIGKVLLKYKSEDYKNNIINTSRSADFISKLQELDLRTYMVDDILTKVDRVSMQNSLEVRVPLLDHKFAELTFKIPSQLKYQGGLKKYIFRKTMQPFLPENVINHKKQGFSVPLKNWFRKDLNQFINDRLINNSYISNYIDIKNLKKVIRNSEVGDRDLSNQLWSLLFLECWLENSKNIDKK
jgi:asparagine synthase (glutamine-hydrolysing)